MTVDARRRVVVLEGIDWWLEEMTVATGRKMKPFGIYPETELVLEEYPQHPMMGSMALVLVHEGEEMTVATVNLFPECPKLLAENEVWLKGWGENEGVPAALERAGLVTRTGEKMRTGFAEAELAVVSDDVMAMWREAHPETEEEDTDEWEVGPF
ncbi:hypothetical protein [Hyphomicrobium sp. DY-1]|uniref:hypothetical protein n=1 Tax=Hyphomicrobium sp. DY-1 TaxID=3075650 RepID=UPI0039C4B519